MKYILKSMINIPTSVHTINWYEQLLVPSTYHHAVYIIVSPLASTGYLAIGRSNPAYTPLHQKRAIHPLMRTVLSAKEVFR